MNVRAQLRTRDAFLARASGVLARSAADLARALGAERKLSARTRNANSAFQALLRELRIIAEPEAAVPLRRRKLELGATLSALLQERRTGWSATIKRAGAVWCHVDPVHLATMLHELLSNALKYRRGRAVTVRLGVIGDRVQLRVSNHSRWIGPRPSYRRFERGDARRNVPGFGVGLWLTKRLAEAHGGKLRIRSRAGHTEAIMSLPFTRHSRATVELLATVHARPR